MPAGLIGLNAYSVASCQDWPALCTAGFSGALIAQKLREAVVGYAEAAGHWQLELTVNEANARAFALYTREGFSQYGCLPNAIIGAGGSEHDLMLLRILPHPS